MKRGIGKYIDSDAEKGNGELRFIGTRISVVDALHLIQIGYTPEKVAAAYHGLILKEAVEEAVELATKALAQHALRRSTSKRKYSHASDSTRRKHHRARTRKTEAV